MTAPKSSVQRSVLFVQGAGEGTHDAWDDKLVASLRTALGGGYTVRYPRMPDEADPNPQAWKHVLAAELEKVNDGVILVGHSVGAAILLDFLADRAGTSPPPAGVFLIATPFLGEGGWPSDDLRPTRTVAEQLAGGAPLFLYQGTEDETVPLAHVDLFETVLPHATVRRLEGRNHQLNDDLSEVARDIGELR